MGSPSDRRRPTLLTVIVLVAIVLLSIWYSWKPLERTIEGKTTSLFTDTEENRKNGLFGQPLPATTEE